LLLEAGQPFFNPFYIVFLRSIALYERKSTMSMTEASSRYFRQVAGQWDQIRAGYFGPEVRQAAIAKAYLRPEMAVADVGGGTGFLTEALAGLVRRVYLVDASPEMLEAARRNLSHRNNVEFHLSDGLSLPFPDESLDAVFANMYLHHTPDPQAAIAEMVRVLRPGGRLVITDRVCDAGSRKPGWSTSLSIARGSRAVPGLPAPPSPIRPGAKRSSACSSPPVRGACPCGRPLRKTTLPSLRVLLPAPARHRPGLHLVAARLLKGIAPAVALQ
jgi:SAM-dependent methyltransferase